MRNEADRRRAETRPAGRPGSGPARPERARVRVRFRSPDEVYRNFGETLNRGWVLAPVPAHAEIGKSVEVEFKLPGLGAALRTPGEVLDVMPTEGGGMSLLRVGFGALTASDKAEIDRLLRRYRRSHRASRRWRAAGIDSPGRALPH